MSLKSVLYYYITMGEVLHGDARAELEDELEYLEKTINRLVNDVRVLKKGIEPLENQIEAQTLEFNHLRRKLFECFSLGEDGTTVTVNADKILASFGEEAYNYLTDF